MNLITEDKILRLSSSEKLASPYKKSWHKKKDLSGISEISNLWRLLKRIARLLEWLEHCNRKCSVVSMELERQSQKGSMVSRKPWLNLCSRRWLKPTLKRVSKETPGSFPSKFLSSRWNQKQVPDNFPKIWEVTKTLQRLNSSIL